LLTEETGEGLQGKNVLRDASAAVKEKYLSLKNMDL